MLDDQAWCGFGKALCCGDLHHRFTAAEEEKNMVMHTEKIQSAGWLAVARISSRLGLALGIALAEYLLSTAPDNCAGAPPTKS